MVHSIKSDRWLTTENIIYDWTSEGSHYRTEWAAITLRYVWGVAGAL